MFEILLGVIASVALLGPLWWLALLCVFGVGVLFAENEMPGTAVALAAVIIAVLWWFGIANFPMWVWHNPWAFTTWAVSYIGLGIVWSAWKFDMLGRDQAEKYFEAKAAFPGFQTIHVVDEDATAAVRVNNKHAPEQYKEVPDPNNPRVKMENYIPKALDNKYKITNWIALWPASLFWFICSDMVHRLVNFLIRHFGRFYDALAARHFSAS